MDRRKADRIRLTILEWVFPIGGTVTLLAAFVAALLAR
jgi:hypothetical protein